MKLGAAIALSIISSSSAIHATPTPKCVDLRPALQKIADVLEARYVLPVKGAEGAGKLRHDAAGKQFANFCGDSEAQAAELMRLTYMAIPDLHIRIAFGPAQTEETPASPDNESLESNFGIDEVSRMSGGIGYLKLSSWGPEPWVRPRLAHAMALLRDANAMILDVRGNRGGDGGTVNLVVRSFLPVGAPETMILYNRAGKIAPTKTVEPPWDRFPEKMPVVVLIDKSSASASEGLAAELKEEGRATIMGVRSRGAAHLVRDKASLPGGFTIYIPNYRLAGRVTGTDWESTGVKPDIATESADAKMLAWEYLRLRLKGNAH
jgi:carboxyl-terminal processing protease